MAFARYSYTISEVLTAAKGSIVAGVTEYASAIGIDTLTVDESCVFITFTPDRARGFAENHISVRVEPPFPDTLCGAARIGTRVKRPMIVTIFTRTNLDQTTKDDIWYTDPTLGHYLMEDAVINTFHDRFLFNQDNLNTPLTQTPCHWQPGLAPIGRPTPDNSWGWSQLIFELDYIQKLTTNYNT